MGDRNKKKAMDFIFIVLGIIGVIIRGKGIRGSNKDMEWIGSALAIASFSILTVIWVRSCILAVPK